MELTWLGTAGFKIKTNKQIFFLDPFLTRNKKSVPVQEMSPADINAADQIFISHGHFDHIMDIPQISQGTDADIYCSSTAAATLIKNNLDKSKITPIETPETRYDFKDYSAQPFFSHHVKFDTRLVFSTLLNINVQFFKYLPLLTDYPCGQVISWRFFIEGKVIQFFGSAGSSTKELNALCDPPVDILLLPMQGHSDICDIGIEYVNRLKPKIVIPHHFDNFYPPISQTVDINPFIKKIQAEHKKTTLIVPSLNQTLTL